MTGAENSKSGDFDDYNLFTNSINEVKSLQKKLVNIHNVEDLCQPQKLTAYNHLKSGFKYKIIGLFGIPDMLDAQHNCVYTVLASVFPPGEPYKPKPAQSMFGAEFIADVDFDRSFHKNQFFRQTEYFDLLGIVLKLGDHSALVFDIKKMDLRTGEMSDYGFAIQPLMHRLSDAAYLIGGRY